MKNKTEEYYEEEETPDYYLSRDFVLPILSEFCKWLQEQKLSEKTMEGQVDAVGLFLIDWKRAQSKEDIKEAVYLFDSFIEDFYLDYCWFASCTHMKRIFTGVKKFYTWWAEKGETCPCDVDFLTLTIKEKQKGWLEELR